LLLDRSVSPEAEKRPGKLGGRMILRTIDLISRTSGLIAAWLIVPLILATCYEVVSRYVFGAPTIWAYEIGYLMTGAGFLLGMAYTLNRGAHIRIDVLNLTCKAQAFVDLVGYVFLFVPFVTWLSFALYGRAVDAMQTLERSGQSAWNPVVWPFRTVFFVSFVLLLVQVIGELIKAGRVLAGREKA
jgi:TRAP-type mannitol/chloroaromatic compound transport system permease small subunit